MQAQSVQKLLLSITEVCEVTGLGRTKVYELIKEGDLPVVKFGRRTLVSLNALENLIKRRSTSGGS